MSFPLSRHHGAVVFLDDDLGMGDVYKDCFFSMWPIRTFSSPSVFVEYMREQIATEADMATYLRSSISRARSGKGTIAMEALRFWNAFPQRFNLPRVVVVDYHMPEMNGFDTLKAIREWGGQRMCISGIASEEVVSAAFNDRVIDYYIPKQNTGLIEAIPVGINKLLQRSFAEGGNLWNPWYTSMDSMQYLTMRDPVVSDELFKHVSAEYEHISIGDPFGVLMLSGQGKLRWLQLETSESLDSAADVAVERGLPESEASAVRFGRSLSNARILKALGISAKVELADPVMQVRVPQLNSVLTGSVFDIECVGTPPVEACFDAWRAKHSA
jgi:CheY-like chemotaxis protein